MIYLDNNSTTPLHPKVKEKITEAMEYYGNPSSAHEIGRRARMVIENARKEIAEFLGCYEDELIFTASGSEANNTVLKSVSCCSTGCNCSSGKKHIITTKIEHPSVLNTAKCLEQEGIEVTFLDVDKYGMVSPESVEKAIRPNTILISVMFANNEIGTVQPIAEIVKIAKKHNIKIHTDAVQAIGKVPINLSELEVDYLSLSGHKIYAPKGVGVLFKRRGTKEILCPLISGGHQEQSLRAGTENTIGIAALGEAFRLLKLEMGSEIKHLKFLRDKLEKGITSSLQHTIINGHPTDRLPGTLNISFMGIEGESILLRLDLLGICVSTGSACSSGSLEPSPVIMALGVGAEMAHGSIRFSIGRENTEEEIDFTIKTVKDVVDALRKISPIKL